MSPIIHSEFGYGWPEIPASLRGWPIVLLDVDGTLRGDVLPMVKLARPLVPNYMAKLTLQQSLNFYKVIGFTWSVGRLWALRVLFSEQRRRYKRLFSELHYLAASLLAGTALDELRARYQRDLPGMRNLWSEHAIELLRRLTRENVVVLVTGSEQAQTEECVRLLAGQNVALERILVRGSLYGFDVARQCYTGRVEALNVTLDGKRDAVHSLGGDNSAPVIGAIGNSRPDRALFERVDRGGLCALVCSESVVRKRRQSTFVLRKFRASGYSVTWDAECYEQQLRSYANGGSARPILATDHTFRAILDNLLNAHGQQLIKPTPSEALQTARSSVR